MKVNREIRELPKIKVAYIKVLMKRNNDHLIARVLHILKTKNGRSITEKIEV